MYRITESDTLDGLIADLKRIPVNAKRELSNVVRDSAREGNRIAKGFASEQHTMHSDIDVPYAASFSAEKRGATEWVYGPVDDGIPHGGQQARGYEHGSRNQPPHLDLARSADIIGPKFARDVSKVADDLFWPGAG